MLIENVASTPTGRTTHDPQLDLWFAQRRRCWELRQIELDELVHELAARPHLWSHLIDDVGRGTVSVRLHVDDTLEVWLMTRGATASIHAFSPPLAEGFSELNAAVLSRRSGSARETFRR